MTQDVSVLALINQAKRRLRSVDESDPAEDHFSVNEDVLTLVLKMEAALLPEGTELVYTSEFQNRPRGAFVPKVAKKSDGGGDGT